MPIALNVVLNSTLTILFKEQNGRVNLGEGALDTAVYEAVRLPIVDPRIIQNRNLQELEHDLAKRDVLSVNEEIRTREHVAIDEAIFEVFDFTNGEREAVYEAVIGLVNNRIRKAESLD